MTTQVNGISSSLKLIYPIATLAVPRLCKCGSLLQRVLIFMLGYLLLSELEISGTELSVLEGKGLELVYYDRLPTTVFLQTMRIYVDMPRWEVNHTAEQQSIIAAAL